MLKEANKGYITAFFGKGCTPMHWFKDHGYDVTDFHHKHPNGNAHGDWWEPAEKTQSQKTTPSVSSVWQRLLKIFLKQRGRDQKTVLHDGLSLCRARTEYIPQKHTS